MKKEFSTKFLLITCLFLTVRGNTERNCSSIQGINNEASVNNKRYVWQWKCIDQKCVKKISEGPFPQSLETCNMICGDIPLWPKPKNITHTRRGFLTFRRDDLVFNLTANSLEVESLLQHSYNIFLNNLKENTSLSDEKLEVYIHCFVSSNVTDLTLKTNESYVLGIASEGLTQLNVSIRADTYFGARHGLETLSQLIWYDKRDDSLKIIHSIEIFDFPSFPYRGVMIDTARNFFGLTSLKKAIDGMAASKLNMLHLHLTDSSSFPIRLPSCPQLAEFGAYDEEMVFTEDDIKDLVAYSKVRGIKVVLEVDAPSHISDAWNYVDRKECEKWTVCDDFDILVAQLNPNSSEVLERLELIYRDLINLSAQKNYFHVGVDEVNLECWSNYEWFNMYSFWIKYVNNMLERLRSANDNRFPDNIFLWSSPLTSSSELDKIKAKENIIIQYWFGDPRNFINSNFKVLYSTVGHWYLDCGFGHWKSDPLHGVCDPYTDWKKFYFYQPWLKYGNINYTVGGEVCLWSELVGEDTLETRLWPRTAAFAERVWLDPKTYEVKEVAWRLDIHRNRLTERGIRSETLWPKWCSQNPLVC